MSKFDIGICYHSAYFMISLIIGGRVYNHNDIARSTNQSVNDGDEWSMEVDLRSRLKSKRTLHWFVNGEQQEGFITGVPGRVEFGV